MQLTTFAVTIVFDNICEHFLIDNLWVQCCSWKLFMYCCNQQLLYTLYAIDKFCNHSCWQIPSICIISIHWIYISFVELLSLIIFFWLLPHNFSIGPKIFCPNICLDPKKFSARKIFFGPKNFLGQKCFRPQKNFQG